MYKSKKNWVVAPVVLVSLLGSFVPATVSLSNAVTVSAAEVTGFVKDAYNKINALPVTELTNDQKASLLNGFDKLTEDQALAKLKEAYKLVADNVAKTVETTKATETINALKNVTATTYTSKVDAIAKTVSDAVTKFKSGVDTDVTKDTDKYATLRAALDEVVAKAKNDLAAVVADAQNADKVNASFDLKKADALSQLSKLTYLNATQVADFTKQINAVLSSSKTFVSEFDTIVNNAKTANKKYVDAAVADVQTEINKLAAGDTKDALQAKLNKVTTVEAANTLLAEVKAEVAKQELANAKADAKNTINTFAPTDSQYMGDANKSKLATLRADYVKKVDAATSVDEVKSILTAFKAEVTGLQNTKTDATTEVNGLANLSAVDKANYAYAIDQSTTKEAVVALLNDAKAKDAKNLADAKAAATTTVNEKTYLTDDAKKALLAELEKAKSLTEVSSVVSKAKTQDEAAKATAELADAKKAALSELAGLKSFADVATYKDQVEKATTKDAVTKAVNDARVAYTAVLTAEKDLAKAKTEAKELVSSLSNLTDAEKAQAVKDIEAGKTVAEVQATFTSATKLDATNAAAAQAAKKLAEDKKAEIEALAKDTYLTAEQKADFTNKINSAKDSAELAKVKTEITNAISDAKTAAQKLADAIKDATDTIDKLTKLSDVQKYEFKIKALNAKTPTEAANVKLEAQLTNLDLITDKAAYITEAKKLLFTTDAQNGLTSAQKAAYSDAIDKAESREAAKALIDEAVAKAAEQSDAKTTAAIDKLLAAGYVNQAKAKLAELRVDANKVAYTAKVEAATELVNAKLAAQDLVNKADYVPAKDKAGYIAKINDAKSVDEVNKVLDEVKALAPATAVQLYRLYNPFSHEHLYTASKDEYDYLGSIGWQQEEFAWTAPSKGEEVYRLYNPFSGEHFYTMSTKEYNDLAKLGWKQEGLAFYSNSKDGNPLDNSVSIYRLYNPFEKGAGSHHFTTSTEERDHLVSLGWRAEGVGFFGLKK